MILSGRKEAAPPTTCFAATDVGHLARILRHKPINKTTGKILYHYHTYVVLNRKQEKVRSLMMMVTIPQIKYAYYEFVS